MFLVHKTMDTENATDHPISIAKIVTPRRAWQRIGRKATRGREFENLQSISGEAKLEQAAKLPASQQYPGL